MPIVLPAEPWKLTGRWEAYGDLMFRLAGPSRTASSSSGPTQEEVAAPLVQQSSPPTATCP